VFLQVQETEISWWEEPIFFLEIDFHIEERNESALAHGVTLGSHHIPMEKKKLVLF